MVILLITVCPSHPIFGITHSARCCSERKGGAHLSGRSNMGEGHLDCRLPRDLGAIATQSDLKPFHKDRYPADLCCWVVVG